LLLSALWAGDIDRSAPHYHLQAPALSSKRRRCELVEAKGVHGILVGGVNAPLPPEAKQIMKI